MAERISAALSGAIASIDINAENTRHVEISRELDKIDSAMDQARNRIFEIEALLNARGNDDQAALVYAREAADALLMGQNPTQAVAVATDPDDLRKEREQIRAALRELSERKLNAQSALRSIEATACQAAGVATRAIADQLQGEMTELAADILERFAILSSLASATRSHRDLVQIAERGVAGLAGNGAPGLLPAMRMVAVPDDVADALRKIATCGPAIKVQVPPTVSIPLDNDTPLAIAAVSAAAARRVVG